MGFIRMGFISAGFFECSIQYSDINKGLTLIPSQSSSQFWDFNSNQQPA